MIDILINLISGALLLGFTWFVYMSSVLVSERKARYRAGTHDYYDNPIVDKDKDSDTV